MCVSFRRSAREADSYSLELAARMLLIQYSQFYEKFTLLQLLHECERGEDHLRT